MSISVTLMKLLILSTVLSFSRRRHLLVEYANPMLSPVPSELSTVRHIPNLTVLLRYRSQQFHLRYQPS
jgi:hypothetical protein